MKTDDEALDILIGKLEARWRVTGRMGKKTKSLVRRCLWVGANVHHFELAGLSKEIVLPIYKEMPESFHETRAKAAIAKRKKEMGNEQA